MNGNDIFADTNVCIYLLNGDLVLANLLQGQRVFISIITEMELYAYHSSNEAARLTLDAFIESVSIVNITEKVKINAIEIRKTTKLKLPDAIIAASAISHNAPLVSADKELQKVTKLDLILYDLQQ